MKKIVASAVSFYSSTVFGIAITWLIWFVLLMPHLLYDPMDGGPLDLNPRVEASATSPDGNLTAQIIRQRISYDPEIRLTIKVVDGRGALVYEKMIATDGAWNELDGAYEIKIDREVIRYGSVGRVGYHVIQRAHLEKQ